MEQFVKVWIKERECFAYLCENFPRLSCKKLRAGIFNSPQIRRLQKNPRFINSMKNEKIGAWMSFAEVVSNFLGNHKAENYCELVEPLLSSFEALGCNMSVKAQFLHSRLSYFLENLGALSEEQRERFHQDL